MYFLIVGDDGDFYREVCFTPYKTLEDAEKDIQNLSNRFARAIVVRIEKEFRLKHTCVPEEIKNEN